jgi:hypothetical protein
MWQLFYRDTPSWGEMLLDRAKAELAEDVLNGNFEQKWKKVWAPKMKQLITADKLELEMLSESVRDVFFSANDGGRQPEQAGLQWRRFLWCTLSLISINTNHLVVCGHPMIKKSLPEWIVEKLQISIGEGRGLSHNPDLVLVRLKPQYAKLTAWSEHDVCSLKNHLDANPDVVSELVVLWTKTNFNDLIQQPMLWARISMLHQAGSEPPVKHAWVTVPSQKLDKFRPGTAPFVRASTFDYGAFWGIGKSDLFGMGSIFDIFPDWRENVAAIQELAPESMLFKKLGLLD